MSAGNGLLALLVRLVSGRLVHEIGAYARREVRLVIVAAVGFVGFLTFLLGAAATAVIMLYTVLVPRLGPLESCGVLIGVALSIALVSLLVAMMAAKAFTRWEGLPKRQPKPKPLRAHDDDASLALLISAILGGLMSGSRRRAPR